MTLAKAWSRNPYLLEFQAAHGLATPWAVPMPREADYLPYTILSRWPFRVVFDKHLSVARLTSTRDGHLNWHALNEARHFYTGMLLWVHSMTVTGRVCSIRPFLQCQDGDLPESSGREQVALSKRLWEAIKQVGCRRLFQMPLLLPAVPRKRLILPLPAKRTAPAVLARELKRKFKHCVKEEEDSGED